jgi:hypothetical protein
MEWLEISGESRKERVKAKKRKRSTSNGTLGERRLTVPKSQSECPVTLTPNLF